MTVKPLAIVDDSRSISYAELNKTISRTAYYYKKKGICQKEHIAIIGENSIEYVIAIFSLWKLGAIPVPINNRLSKNEIDKIINSADCSHAIVDNLYKTISIGIEKIEMLIKLEGEECTEKIDTKPSDYAVIIHTSGSSGNPKGVITTNGNLYSSFVSANKYFNFSAEDVFLASLPFYHIGGFSIINRMLLSGGTLLIPKSLKLPEVLKTLTEKRPTVVSLVPTVLKRIIDLEVKPNSNLRLLFLGGGPSDDDLIFNSLKEGWPVVKVYGSSETTAMVTACWGENLRKNPSSAGKIFDGIELKTFNKTIEAGNKEIGEIAVKGEMVTAGYINNSELWNRKLSNGFYFTGDFGFLDNEENLFVVSRRSDLIVSGGENIVPNEIEKVLNNHPKIRESKVFGVNNSEWGQLVCVAIIQNEQEIINDEEIKNYLKNKIASYKIPKRIIRLDKFPKTELGKIKIQELKKMVN